MDNKTEEQAMAISLDDYIRQRQAVSPVGLLNLRKNKTEISEASLTKSLDDYIKSRTAKSSREMDANNTSNGLGKFDRKSIRDDVDSDEGSNDQVCTDWPRFETIEGVNKVRVRSQQFRLLPENIVDRPEGARRLAFLPRSEAKVLKRVFKGRVQKSKSNSGTFIEKGSFTYKFGHRVAGSKKRIIGIERAKTVQPNPEPIAQSIAAAPVININFNMSSPPSDVVSSVINSLPGVSRNVSSAVTNALNLLRRKREERRLNMNSQLMQRDESLQFIPSEMAGTGSHRCTWN